jgi:hypothetical protein
MIVVKVFLLILVLVVVHASTNAFHEKNKVRVSLPQQFIFSYRPSVFLRQFLSGILPELSLSSNNRYDGDDGIEPIDAGAPNKGASNPDNPVTPCTPVAGKTAIIIGQDYNSILNYTTSFAGHPSSIGYMAYTALQNDYGELTGLKHRIDYGGGVQWVDGLAKMYPTASIQLGLWLVGFCEEIVAGALDHNIQRLAKYIKDHGKHHSFFLRIGYEFDSAENHYDAGFYRVAFQRIVNIFREVNTTNVAFVWHASGFSPRDNLRISDWYPGARYVDWCGVSLFQQPYSCSGDPALCTMQPVEDLVEFCKRQNIPVMIAESTPYGGIVDEHTVMKNPEAHNEAGYVGDTWSRWFQPVLSFIERHDIRIWSYINCNWDLQKMWQIHHAPNEHWGDTRVEAYNDMRNKWLEHVLHSSRFQMYTSPSSRNPTPDVSTSKSVENSRLRQRNLQTEADPKQEVDTKENVTAHSFPPSSPPTASPSVSISPSAAPTAFPTVPVNTPVGRLKADVCTPPRTQVLLQKHPDFTDDEYGDRTIDSDTNHSLPLPSGGGSIPHHRHDFYTRTEKIILKNTLEIIVFFLEVLEVFLAITFLVAVLVLMLSCLYKLCSRGIDQYHELSDHRDLLRSASRILQREKTTKKTDTTNDANGNYQAIAQQDEEVSNRIGSEIESSEHQKTTTKRKVDRKGYVVLE